MAMTLFLAQTNSRVYILVPILIEKKKKKFRLEFVISYNPTEDSLIKHLFYYFKDCKLFEWINWKIKYIRTIFLFIIFMIRRHKV